MEEPVEIASWALEEALQTEDLDTVIRCATELIKQVENNDEKLRGRLFRAIFHFLNKDREHGLADFRAVVADMPQDVANYCDAATVFYLLLDKVYDVFHEMELFDVAMAHCDTGIRIGEKDAELDKTAMAHLYQLRAVLRWVETEESAELLKAIGDFKKAFELLPDDRRYLPEPFWVFPKTLPVLELLHGEKRDVDELLRLAAPLFEDPEIPQTVKCGLHDICSRFLFEVGRYREAAEAATKAIEAGPRDLTIYTVRAQSYYELKEYRKAEDDFSWLYDVAENDSDRSDALQGRALACFGRGDYAESLMRFNESLRLNPENIDSLRWRAWLRLTVEDFDACLLDCDAALARDPSLAGVYVTKGHALAGEKKYEKAVEAYGKAFELDPLHAEAVWNRGHCYYELGELEKALADTAKAAELDSDGYGKARERFEHVARSVYDGEYPPEKAIEYLTECLEKEPNNLNGRLHRAFRYMQQENWEKALDDFREAVRLEPDELEIRFRRFAVALYFYVENKAMAENRGVDDILIVDGTKMLEAPVDDGNQTMILAIRGIVYRNQKKYDKSLADFEACLKDEEFAGHVRLRCALLLVRLAENGSNVRENLEKAMEYAEAVLKSGEFDDQARFVRGKVYQAMNENEKAQADFEEARRQGFDGDEETFFNIDFSGRD